MVNGSPLRLWLAAALVSLGSITAATGLAQDASGPAAAAGVADNPAASLARVEDLKHEAYRALSAGEFARTHQLIEQALQVGRDDPLLAKMKGWLADYESHAAVGAAARKKDFDEAVANATKLHEAGLEPYAFDAVASAYIHADDKEAFRAEGWVVESLARMTDLAAAAEAKGDWLGARRLYTNLSAVEPLTPRWRTKINEVSRRLNLLGTYAPDRLEAAYKADTETRKRVLEIVDPAKAAIAATRPAAEDVMNDDFKIDWKQMLAGVKVDMLREALDDIRQNYYRETSYPELVAGGVVGLEQLVTTTGIESTFASLGELDARAAFAASLRTIKEAAAAPDGVKDRRLLSNALNAVLTANRATLRLPDEVIVYEFGNGATAVLDPFTNVIWPFDLPEFQKSTQGDFTGVGIQIRNDTDGYLKVVSPLPDSPAYRAGIKAEDIVTQINGKNAKGVTTIQAVKAITGPAGSSVTLTVRSPDGVTKEHKLLRQTIKVASVKGWTQRPGGAWEWLVDADNGIGYMRLTNFTKESSREIADAIGQIRRQRGRAIILDLRQNPGGLLSSACEIADKFLKQGNIVSTRSAKNEMTAPPIDARSTGDDVDLPVVVLVNQYSASASEIVSGALKDHRRALIVGERTFGKGSVQMLFPLEQREAYLKMTTSHYYLPSGRCLHREEDSTEWGVEPNVTVEMTPEQMANILNLRQNMDVLRDQGATNAATLPAEFKTPEEQLLASDPQLGAAVLMLRMALVGAPVM